MESKRANEYCSLPEEKSVAVAAATFLISFFNQTTKNLIKSRNKHDGFRTSCAASPMSLAIYLLLFCTVLSAVPTLSEDFIQCLSDNSDPSITNVVYTPNNSSYESVLMLSPKALFSTTSFTQRPSFIITPLRDSHFQAAVICSKRHGFLLRLRSGGHDYEGQSNRAPKPFVMLEFKNYRDISVDIKRNIVWAQAGASIGELYYRIAEKSNTHGFPAGRCPTVGIGAHIGGGALGFLRRKYGTGADNALDVKFVDANGKLHNRKSMGEDLFWALRGGGVNSFGVVLAWKLRLVRVAPIVTHFRVERTLEQDGSSIFNKWQNIAHKLPRDIFIDCEVQPVQGEKSRTINFLFIASFHGRIRELLSLMEKNFPELGLTTEDCREMRWIEATVLQALVTGPPEVLLNRSLPSIEYFKGRYDFLEKTIPMVGLEGLWKVMLKDDTIPILGFEPLGGILSEIPEDAIPYPHRKGNIISLRYIQSWPSDSETAINMESARRVYDYMTPYVTKSPRGAYVNCKDLDLGVNRNANTPYSEARVWGEQYFKDNFARLAMVKSKIDPENYFWDQQSIPPFK